MKNLIFSSLVSLALLTFTGCTNGSDAETAKCQSGKCDGAKKCAGDKKSDTAKKCDSSGKCGK